jgi:hypothetical protein
MWSRNMDRDKVKHVHTSRLMAAAIQFICKGYRRESHKRENNSREYEDKYLVRQIKKVTIGQYGDFSIFILYLLLVNSAV